jgi:hypothetical protein
MFKSPYIVRTTISSVVVLFSLLLLWHAVTLPRASTATGAIGVAIEFMLCISFSGVLGVAGVASLLSVYQKVKAAEPETTTEAVTEAKKPDASV